jgi:transcriptional regulator with XRE-family HTH domain
MAARQGRLGEYLRARRERTTPAQAGVAIVGERRRVPGLKRGEVAQLAGISAEYYTRLEQGHDRRPSAQVLGALARALCLDEPSTAYLFELAAPPGPARVAGSAGSTESGTSAGPDRQRPGHRAEPVSASLPLLLDSWPRNPAFVQGRHMDVLAANSLMVALSPMYRPGTNIVRAAFLDHAVEALFADPETRLENVVSALRALVGADTDDPYLTELVAEVSAKSAQFRLLWSRHDVRPHPGGGIHRLHHPIVGDLELSYDKFLLVGADRQMLTVYQAEPGSPSEKALALLAAAADT